MEAPVKRLSGVGVLLLVASAMLGALPSAARTARAADASVTATNFAFTQASVTIDAGEMVIWTNGAGTHSVTFDNNELPEQDPLTLYQLTFDTAGTYKYYCKYHGAPNGQGMSGTVTVLAVAASPTATATVTNTPAATNTPGATSTPDKTAAPATNTPAAAATAAGAATATPAAAIATAPAQPSGAAGAGAQLPRTGAGPSRGGLPSWPSILLAAAGAAAIAAAVALRKRA
jgi:plastocyanin